MWLVTSRTTTSRRRSEGTVWGMSASGWMPGAAPRRPLLVGSLGRGARPGLLRGGQADVEVRHISHVGPIRRRPEVHNQAVLDREHRVVLKILVVAVEDLRDEFLMAGSANAEVNVRRPVGVPIHHLEQLAGRTIEGNRVLRRPNAAEGVAAL